MGRVQRAPDRGMRAEAAREGFSATAAMRSSAGPVGTCRRAIVSGIVGLTDRADVIVVYSRPAHKGFVTDR